MSGQQSNTQQLKSPTAMKFAVTYGQTQLALLPKCSHLSVTTTIYFVQTSFTFLNTILRSVQPLSSPLHCGTPQQPSTLSTKEFYSTPPPPPFPSIGQCTLWFRCVLLFCGFSCVQLHSWSSLYNDNEFPALNLEVSDVMTIRPPFSTSTFTLSC